MKTKIVIIIAVLIIAAFLLYLYFKKKAQQQVNANPTAVNLADNVTVVIPRPDFSGLNLADRV